MSLESNYMDPTLRKLITEFNEQYDDGNGKFVNGRSLLESKDRHGFDPELLMNTSKVRGPGKTSYWTALLTYVYFNYPNKEGKFVLLVRAQKELGTVADGMMKDMLYRLYPDYSVSEKLQQKGTYSKIFFEKGIGEEKEIEHVGYVLPLNAADSIKRISSMFTDTVHAYMDEFMPEFNSTYVSGEVEKFNSIHKSIARGKGKSRRHYPVYMSGNTVRIDNPYFDALGMTSKIQPDTMSYKGDGYVYLRTENKALAERHSLSPMDRAFSGLNSIDYLDNSWLNDDYTGVEKAGGWGRASYVCTLLDGDLRYAVKHYRDVGLFYVDHKVDGGSQNVYNINIDGKLNVQLINTAGVFTTLRTKLFNGQMRFANVRIKNAMMELLA